jgi:uncharacterized membrane protein YeaQ/YmgE (transglycosylase-associated protein family)
VDLARDERFGWVSSATCTGSGHPASAGTGARAGPDEGERNVIGQIIGLLVVGLIIGALARLIKPGKQRMSILMTMVLGVVGAFIGGFLGGLINDSTNVFELNILGFIFAVIAAVLLIGVAEALSSRGSRGAVH